jgi:D-alanyl-D-alanine dipeptidase
MVEVATMLRTRFPAACLFATPFFFVTHFAAAEHIQTFHVRPLQPIAELRAQALHAVPPSEPGRFRKPELVDLATLGAPLRFEIRYATANNFLGVPVYTQPRAFLERPAAEALLAAARDLEKRGFGLLIYDGYRPWYVTRIFWDATPRRLHTFVADPARGSKHNRGCAVDLTLYDLKTGGPVEMPSGYDEMTVRAHPDYAAGPATARAHRAILRNAMEAHGFTVDPGEWWHFDFSQWRQFPILNVPFESLPGS